MANLEDLISYCAAYGTTYNPTKNSIKLTQLNSLLVSAKASLTLATSTNTALKNAANAREIAFEPMRKLGTKILNALTACGATEQTLDDAKTIKRKIDGRSAKLTKADAGIVAAEGEGESNSVVESPEPTSKKISTSQMSYDSLIEHYSKLVALLGSEPLYNPNEPSLKVPALKTLITILSNINTTVINATTAWSNARINRDKILYQADIGVYDVAKDVKAYVKSIFGATSPEAKQLTGVLFTKIK